MANPQVHARSSARRFGGRWEDYIELHAFLDSSKLHYAKASHRALLHHDFGKQLAIVIFGKTELDGRVTMPISEAYLPGKYPTVESVVDQHFAEDFTRFTPSVSKWFEGSYACDRPGMSKPPLTVDEQCAESVRHFGGDPEDYRGLHEFIDSIMGEVEGAWGITHSTFGLGLAEQYFGYTIGPRCVPTRTVAEKHILAEYYAIPSAQDWLMAVPIQPWMYNQAASLSVELEMQNA
jgi:hypothetical protein